MAVFFHCSISVKYPPLDHPRITLLDHFRFLGGRKIMWPKSIPLSTKWEEEPIWTWCAYQAEKIFRQFIVRICQRNFNTIGYIDTGSDRIPHCGFYASSRPNALFQSLSHRFHLPDRHNLSCHPYTSSGGRVVAAPRYTYTVPLIELSYWSKLWFTAPSCSPEISFLPILSLFLSSAT